METILNYLDNMFVNMPKTPEVLRAKEDLAEMMEDKYNELIAEGRLQNEAIGIVISEFGNIQELIDELDIQNGSETEESAAKEQEKEPFKEEDISFTKTRHVSGMEADEYLFVSKQAASQLAAGIFLCICSPVMLLLLLAIRSFLFSIAEGVAVGAGVTVLLCMVACAVALFITASMKMERYEYLKTECFTLDPVYEQSMRNIWEMQVRNKVAYKITIGVVLCILAVIPVILTGVFVSESGNNEFLVLLSVICLLVIIAIAVSLFVTGGMEEEAYKVILQEKEFSPRKKSEKKMADFVSGIYWSVVVIVYLVWSFLTGRWGISWIIWPIAGILYDVVCKVFECCVHEKEI